eukprot:Tamp_07313.p1 GENE.Tamp_07313~~Tamp_07313.p1  ORF type:complete len:364 (-),score=63.31 Tamp_07313:585-1676(-)
MALPMAGETALHLAAAHGRVECVRLLLKMSTTSWKDWWIERKDGRSGDTALHRACAEGQAEVVRLLLDEKANPSLTNQLGRTPMHLAVKASDAAIVKYLLRAGASQMSLDLDGRRPIAAGAGPWVSAAPEALKVEYWSPLKQTSDERALQHHNASMVKMALADMGTGNVGARQGYITKTRQDNANARRRAAWRVSAGGNATLSQRRRCCCTHDRGRSAEKRSCSKNMAQRWPCFAMAAMRRIDEYCAAYGVTRFNAHATGGFTETDNQRLDRENEARRQRLAIRMYEMERDGVEWRLRSAWAHAKIKEVWQAYKFKKEEERRERERQRRKEEADRTRRMLAVHGGEGGILQPPISHQEVTAGA